jgi:hypothetical protein
MEYGLKVSKSNITHVASGKMLQVDILNLKLYINLVWACKLVHSRFILTISRNVMKKYKWEGFKDFHNSLYIYI